jgi:PAS domain S-box-containing protein/excisionase family DNA binding protein
MDLYGSAFWARDAAKAASPPLAPRADWMGTQRVVYVADGSDDALLVREMLVNDPAFSVEHVATLTEAVSVIPPIGVACCVLLDLALPDADGFEGLHEIRRFAPHVPTIVLTGREDDFACFRAISAGAQKYLVKGRFTGGILRRAIRDAIERKNSADALDDPSQRFRPPAESGRVGTVLVSAGHRHHCVVLDANPAFVSMAGRPLDGLVGEELHGIVAPDDVSRFSLDLQAIVTGERLQGQSIYSLRGDAGGPRLCTITGSVLRDPSGVPQCASVMFHDITGEVRRAEQLGHMLEALDKASCGIAMLDIGGNYVSANPTHAQILGRTPEELIGGPWHLGLAEADREPVRQAIARASNVGVQRIEARGTRGDGTVFDAEMEIIANTGTAGALEGWHYFLRDVSWRKPAQGEARGSSVRPAQREPEPDLVAALRSGQLSLVLQPIVSTVDQSLVACEALVRWSHPFRGDISPEEFIPTAERTGAITALGEWVLSEACRQLAEWSHHGGEMADVAMWVNVSATQLDDPAFSDRVRSILAETGVEASRLSLELTETALVDLQGRVAGRSLEQLRELGLRIILDDFGSGYSSLSYICRLPISGIKLDRSFVAQLRDDHSVIPIVDAVAAMARSLSVSLVAEGIETEHQLDTVVELGCTLAQGYMIARPMPAGEVCEWALRRSADPAAAANRPARPTVGIGEAAHDLCVSASTIRRWADCGRLTSTRTAGGHRRILTADVRTEVRRLLPEVKLNTTSAPSTPAPAAADLLDTKGEAIIAAAAGDVYASRTTGWFASMNSQAARRRWVSALAEACRTGTYLGAIRVSVALFRQADQEGATLLERHLVAGRVRVRLVHLLRAGRAEDTEIVTVVRLMQAIEHATLGAA